MVSPWYRRYQQSRSRLFLSPECFRQKSMWAQYDNMIDIVEVTLTWEMIQLN